MKKIFRTILLILIVLGIILVIRTFIKQQKSINSLAKEKKEYTNEIMNAKQKQNELNETLRDLNSVNFIENIARERLGMYYPNEKVYIDSSK